MTPPAPLRLRLDGKALVSNWKWLAAKSGAAACGAAVKADAYGLGASEAVSRLAKAGCRDFFVAHWAEAAGIADLIPPGQVSVLNGIGEDDIAFARQLGAVPVLNTPHQIALWRQSGGGRCHVMLDSGINRLGIGPEQLTPGLLDGIEIDILMSHLASADEDVPQNDTQLQSFMAMSQAIDCKRRSIANSAGIMLGRAYSLDLTRPGISLYGGIVREEQRGPIAPVVSIEAKILQVREVRAGQAIGYNATYRCERAMRIATLAVGYADGYWRGFSGKGGARFNGVAMPGIGRVSMDLAIFDASHAPGVAEGHWAQLDYDLPTAAALSGLSQYELLTGLGRRAARSWI